MAINFYTPFLLAPNVTDAACILQDPSGSQPKMICVIETPDGRIELLVRSVFNKELAPPVDVFDDPPHTYARIIKERDGFTVAASKIGGGSAFNIDLQEFYPNGTIRRQMNSFPTSVSTHKIFDGVALPTDEKGFVWARDSTIAQVYVGRVSPDGVITGVRAGSGFGTGVVVHSTTVIPYLDDPGVFAYCWSIAFSSYSRTHCQKLDGDSITGGKDSTG